MSISAHEEEEAKRTAKKRAGPRFGGFWRTRARGSLDSARAPGNEKKRGIGDGEPRVRLASVRNIRVLRRPSGCALHRDAHHTTIPVATATILTARLPTHLEGKPAGEPAERARRENRTSGGDGLVASGRYITCVLPAAVLNTPDLPPVAPGAETMRERRTIEFCRRDFRRRMS